MTRTIAFTYTKKSCPGEITYFWYNNGLREFFLKFNHNVIEHFVKCVSRVLPLSAFSNGTNGSLLLGYLEARNSTLANSAYENMSNSAKNNSNPYYGNGTTTHGLKYFNISFPLGYGLPGSSIYVSQYNSYLIFEVYTGAHVSNTSLLGLLDSESGIL